MSDAPFPRLLPGRPGTSTEGRAFIATLKEDEKYATRIREAGGEILRERDGALIWGFPTTTTLSDVEALCRSLSNPEPEMVPSAASEGWNFDISAAPTGGERTITGKVGGSRDYERKSHIKEHIFAAGTGGVVTVSYWIPDQGRWNMFTKAVPPMAWRTYVEGAPLPRHPLAG
jgi:hypothetical protein